MSNVLSFITGIFPLLCLAFLLPLDIWRFLFHSTITEKFISKRINRKLRYTLTTRWIYLYWILFSIIIFLNGKLILKYKLILGNYAIYFGIVLILIGISLAAWAASSLGINIARRVPEVSSHEKGRLVTKGPYRIVRHPIYLGEFLVILGAFFMSGVVFILLQFILKSLFANSVISWEEKEMKKRFGKKYEEYRKAVSKLFPIFLKLR
jgi:protein-S-isoprenylcysteine O-methyltransferase Ste14